MFGIKIYKQENGNLNAVQYIYLPDPHSVYVILYCIASTEIFIFIRLDYGSVYELE